MNAYRKTVWILFGIFVVANTAYLHRVPGLLGDEASEGENVYELLQSNKTVIEGERSYIGPLIDYVRVPFVLVFGYTPLALRIVVLVASFVTFWLAASILQKYFGETPALFALALTFLNPIYLTQARLGWAITLFPFFLFLILFLARRPLLAGLVAGIGLSNHVLFLPTIIALVVMGTVAGGRKILSYWPALISFWAGFGVQFAVLLLNREDQGDISAVAQTFWERVHDLPKLLSHVLSGSSYIASYTGAGLLPLWQWIIVSILAILMIFALVRQKTARLAFLGIMIQVLVLLFMIDRFSLRYFALPVIELWLLAGTGLHLRSVNAVGPIIIALGLTIWSTFAILLPFLRTGGSTNDFSLGNRADSAAALVDTRPLISCLRGIGPVFSENIHIWNRLQFLSHQYPDLNVIANDDITYAKYLVEYRNAKHPDPGILCPDLAHFRIL